MEALRNAYSAGQYSQAVALLPALKLQALSSGSFLELSVLASMSYLALGELSQFEKHAILVRNLIRTQTPSDGAYLVTGLLLIHFLASDRIGDFHVTLHLLPAAALSHKFVQYPVEIERAIMEGNYAKVLNTRTPPEMQPYVGALREAVTVKASEVMALATERKFADQPDARVEASASMAVLLSYAQDLQRIV